MAQQTNGQHRKTVRRTAGGDEEGSRGSRTPASGGRPGQHLAMVYENHSHGCLPCQDGTPGNPETRWKGGAAAVVEAVRPPQQEAAAETSSAAAAPARPALRKRPRASEAQTEATRAPLQTEAARLPPPAVVAEPSSAAPARARPALCKKPRASGTQLEATPPPPPLEVARQRLRCPVRLPGSGRSCRHHRADRIACIY